MSCCCHCCCRCCWLNGIQIRIHLVAKTVALARAGGNYGLKFALGPRYKLPWLTLRAVWPCRSSSANCGNSANCAICEWANIKYYRAPTWAFNQHDRVRGAEGEGEWEGASLVGHAVSFQLQLQSLQLAAEIVWQLWGKWVWSALNRLKWEISFWKLGGSRRCWAYNGWGLSGTWWLKDLLWFVVCRTWGSAFRRQLLVVPIFVYCFLFVLLFKKIYKFIRRALSLVGV